MKGNYYGTILLYKDEQAQTGCLLRHLPGLMALSDSFQVPKLEGRELSDVFFQLRLDHPEIFWAEGFHYRYYQDSANITFAGYIFEKGKIKEHQKALKARVEKLVRPAMKLSNGKSMYMILFVKMYIMIS